MLILLVLIQNSARQSFGQPTNMFPNVRPFALVNEKLLLATTSICGYLFLIDLHVIGQIKRLSMTSDDVSTIAKKNPYVIIFQIGPGHH